METRSLLKKSAIIILLGIVFVYQGILDMGISIIPSMIFLIILNSIAESLAIRFKGTSAISVSFTIGLAGVLIFKSYNVAIIGFTSMLLYVEYIDGKWHHIFNSSLYKRIFNCSAYALSLSVSVMGYNAITDFYPGTQLLGFSTIGIITAILTYILINTSIYVILMSLLETVTLGRIIQDNKWAVINVLALSPLGVIIAVAYNNYGWFGVVLFLGPLLLARYSFKLYIDMRHVYFETIKALSNAVEAKDKYTIGHSYRVADYAVGIAEQMGLSGNKVDQIKTAAILHDIGKIGVADSILNKPGHLEESEYTAIQQHPQIGAKILSEVDFLAEVSNIIKYHHERYDGKGYPEGLTAAEIPIEASILSVADAFDAMTSDRPYRKAMDQSVAARILIKESGTQFNPIVVRAFQEYLKSIKIEVISHVS